MATVIDRSSIVCAEEIFKTLGSALLDFQIYGSEHPRFTRTAENLSASILEFFERNPSHQHLTYTRSGKQVEFQKIPLMNTGTHGRTVTAILGSQDYECLQILPGISRQETEELIRVLFQWNRKSAGTALPGDDASPPGDRHFKFIQRLPESGFIPLEPFSTDDPGKDSGGDALALPELKIARATCRSVLTTYRSLVSGIEKGRLPDYGTLIQATDAVVSLFAEKSVDVMPNVLERYFDDFTYHHSVNVTLITASVASAVTDDPELLRRLTLAALLHDVGKSRVPPEILHKPGKLTDAEFDALKEHSAIGAEILLAIEDIDPLCVAIAFTHHMHSGPGSYPVTERPFPLNWVTRLVSVVDIYEALISIRPYKKGLSTRTAFEVMLKMPGLKGRRSMVKLLYDRVGPYPTGNIVELTSGERALVTEQNPSHPHLPRVRILTDPERNRLPAPVEIDLAAPEVQPGDHPRRIRRPVVVESESCDPLTGELDVEPSDILGSPLDNDESLMAREG